MAAADFSSSAMGSSFLQAVAMRTSKASPSGVEQRRIILGIENRFSVR